MKRNREIDGYQVLFVDREALVSSIADVDGRTSSRLYVSQGRLLNKDVSPELPEGGTGHTSFLWPSPLTYRIAELSMLAYPDPSHHSAASDIVAARDRSIIVAGFVGDETEGSQAAWCDRLVGFVQLACFVRCDRRNWFSRIVMGRSEFRSFFAASRTLAIVASGDHFISEIAHEATDEEEVGEVVERLLGGDLRDTEVDIYVSDLVIRSKPILPLFWQRILSIRKTNGVCGFVAVLVPARSLLYSEADFARRMERRAIELNMERVAICPPQTRQEKKTPQELWMGKEIHTRLFQRVFARTKVWFDEHPSTWVVVMIVMFLVGTFGKQLFEFYLGDRLIPQMVEEMEK